MTDNYTSAEMLKLVVKDVHFSVGITDYNGWPTVTIKAPNGQEQWYVYKRQRKEEEKLKDKNEKEIKKLLRK